MWTTRNIALLTAGGIAIATVAYLSGRGSSGSGGRASADDRLIPSRPTSSAPAASSDASGVALTASAAPASVTLADGGAIASPADLFTKLQNERDARPKLEPTADTVFAALKKMGVEVDDETQVAAFTVGARFCNKIRTKKDVHVVVCEFADEAAAIKGVEFGTSKSIKGREVLRNKTTTCAVHQTDEAKQSAAEAAKIKERFKTL